MYYNLRLPVVATYTARVNVQKFYFLPKWSSSVNFMTLSTGSFCFLQNVNTMVITTTMEMFRCSLCFRINSDKLLTAKGYMSLWTLEFSLFEFLFPIFAAVFLYVTE